MRAEAEGGVICEGGSSSASTRPRWAIPHDSVTIAACSWVAPHLREFVYDIHKSVCRSPDSTTYICIDHRPAGSQLAHRRCTAIQITVGSRLWQLSITISTDGDASPYSLILSGAAILWISQLLAANEPVMRQQLKHANAIAQAKYDSFAWRGLWLCIGATAHRHRQGNGTVSHC